MLEKFQNLLETVQKISWSNLITLIIICVLGLGSFYVYRLIEAYEFAIQEQVQTPRDKYFSEFGLEDLKDDLAIRDILTETRLSTKAKQVVLWGYHNGNTIGPFPFKKMSILDESAGEGDQRLADEYQAVPLSLYIELTIRIWETGGDLIYFDLQKAKEDFPNVYYEMIQNDHFYQFLVPITIDGYDPPIGYFGVYLDENQTEKYNLFSHLEQEEFQDFVFEQAKRIELIFNAQYQRARVK